jgi:hypothetical protein
VILVLGFLLLRVGQPLPEAVERGWGLPVTGDLHLPDVHPAASAVIGEAIVPDRVGRWGGA